MGTTPSRRAIATRGKVLSKRRRKKPTRASVAIPRLEDMELVTRKVSLKRLKELWDLLNKPESDGEDTFDEVADLKFRRRDNDDEDEGPSSFMSTSSRFVKLVPFQFI